MDWRSTDLRPSANDRKSPRTLRHTSPGKPPADEHGATLRCSVSPGGPIGGRAIIGGHGEAPGKTGGRGPRGRGTCLDGLASPEPARYQDSRQELSDCLITPHTADTEEMTRPLLVARIVENVRRLATGQTMVGRVDPELGY